ncbi:MAG: LTA synthase family protein [Muribaculaceae bacterium]|nr:LTA synthase family protein [Muribaculaceae bacterium]
MSFSNDDDLGGAGYCTSTSWTMGGLLASSSGVDYKLPGDGNDAGDHEEFLPGLTAMGDILEAAGYRNYFMCGSDAAFGGRLDFFNQHGNYDILDYYGAIEAGVIPEDYYVFWGMEDKHLYEYAKRELTEIANENEPFNFTMLTADTHHSDGYVCELCGDEYPEQYSNVIACADRQVCQFLEWAQTQDWYENTTVIITGDHCSMKADFWADIGDYRRTIYNCFINLPDSLTAKQTTNREFSILDMFPTILTAMGAEIEGEKLGLGTNLFSEELTLPEKMGRGEMNKELELYSDYYYAHFIIGNR